MSEQTSYPANAQAQSLQAALAQQKIVHEHNAFVETYKRRKPIATYVIASIIVVVFLLELLWGGSETYPTLLSMGALKPELVAQGEWWRLASCTFLHSGFTHVFFNTFVLVSIGGFLERTLGSWRFVSVYAMSGLAASAASAYFLENTFSVGASGAIWGLLCAQGVLAYRPQGLIPTHLAERSQKSAKTNLVINVFVSFLPMVDMYAHFGGGIMGGLLIFTGFATQGLGKPNLSGKVVDNISALQKLVTAGAAATLLIGLGLAFQEGKPWALSMPVNNIRAPLGSQPYSVMVPDTLPEQAPQDGMSYDIGYGRPQIDPASLYISLNEFPEVLSTQEIHELAKDLQKRLNQEQDEDLQLLEEPAISQGAEQAIVTARYSTVNSRIYERAHLILPNRTISIEALVWEAFADNYSGIAGSVAKSIEANKALTGPQKAQVQGKQAE